MQRKLVLGIGLMLGWMLVPLASGTTPSSDGAVQTSSAVCQGPVDSNCTHFHGENAIGCQTYVQVLGFVHALASQPCIHTPKG